MVKSKILSSRGHTGRVILRTTLYSIALLGAISMVIPFLWMTITALKTEAQVFTWPPQFIPSPFRFQNFIDAWTAVPFARFFLNSTIVATSVTLGSLLFNSMAGYAFAKLKFPGRDIIFLIVLGSMMVPVFVTIIPVFTLIRYLGWLNTYYALIVPGIASAFGTFLMRQFISTIPNDYLDAARIDGCNEFRIYFSIVLPLCKPAIAALGIFTFMAAWNDFLWPLTMTTTEEMKTLQVGLSFFLSEYIQKWTLHMAGAFFATIPVILVFLFFQRRIIKGITLTGLK